MEQPVFSWRGPGGIAGEAGHPREPGGLEAKAPLGLAVTTLLRGKQTRPSWGGEESSHVALVAVSPCHLVFLQTRGNLRLAAGGKVIDLGVATAAPATSPSSVSPDLLPGLTVSQTEIWVLLAAQNWPPKFSCGKNFKTGRFCPCLCQRPKPLSLL